VSASLGLSRSPTEKSRVVVDPRYDARMSTSVRIEFSETGQPAQVARCVESSCAGPESGEVLVAVRYAPINPADLNYLEGTYGKNATLPAIPGNEGSGIVLAVGAGVESVKAGNVVILLDFIGSWQSQVSVPEACVLKLDPSIDLRQAAMLKVNPPTAWLLLESFVSLNPGDWIAQNASNSGVGRSLIQLAKRRGLRTVNFVRRVELADELKASGADLVFLDSDEGLAQAKEALGDDRPALVSNAVGGDSALRLMDLLADEGIHVTYGAMSRRSLKVPNSFLIFRQIQLRGLWVTKWMERSTPEEVRQVLLELSGLMVTGELKLPVAATYSPDKITGALMHAQEGARDGKILLEFPAL
jgi:trans-2-enoyl-CoA reductase